MPKVITFSNGLVDADKAIELLQDVLIKHPEYVDGMHFIYEIVGGNVVFRHKKLKGKEQVYSDVLSSVVDCELL